MARPKCLFNVVLAISVAACIAIVSVTWAAVARSSREAHLAAYRNDVQDVSTMFQLFLSSSVDAAHAMHPMVAGLWNLRDGWADVEKLNRTLSAMRASFTRHVEADEHRFDYIAFAPNVPMAERPDAERAMSLVRGRSVRFLNSTSGAVLGNVSSLLPVIASGSSNGTEPMLFHDLRTASGHEFGEPLFVDSGDGYIISGPYRGKQTGCGSLAVYSRIRSCQDSRMEGTTCFQPVQSGGAAAFLVSMLCVDPLNDVVLSRRGVDSHMLLQVSANGRQLWQSPGFEAADTVDQELRTIHVHGFPILLWFRHHRQHVHLDAIQVLFIFSQVSAAVLLVATAIAMLWRQRQMAQREIAILADGEKARRQVMKVAFHDFLKTTSAWRMTPTCTAASHALLRFAARPRLARSAGFRLCHHAPPGRRPR